MDRGLDVVSRRADDVADSDQDDVVIYASGVAFGANDARRAAFAAHVADAARWAWAPHRRFAFVSSTRVYDHASSTAEDAVIGLVPESADAYVGSKLAGEALVLGSDESARVVRLSNLAGPAVRSGLFLSDIMRQAANGGVVRLRSALDSSKDYVDVRDAAAWTLDVALDGDERVYNVAAGRNTTHGALLDRLAALVPGLRVEIAPGSATAVAAPIETNRITRAFPRALHDPLAEMPGYFAAFAEAATTSR